MSEWVVISLFRLIRAINIKLMNEFDINASLSLICPLIVFLSSLLIFLSSIWFILFLFLRLQDQSLLLLNEIHEILVLLLVNLLLYLPVPLLHISLPLHPLPLLFNCHLFPLPRNQFPPISWILLLCRNLPSLQNRLLFILNLIDLWLFINCSVNERFVELLTQVPKLPLFQPFSSCIPLLIL